jgi:hypothetical protein
MSEALIKLARSIVDEELWGDIDYYMGKCTERDRVIESLIECIGEQNRKIADLQAKNDRMLSKIVGADIGGM